MAKKISQLTQATEVKSDDVTVIVQDGETKKLPLNMMVTKQDIENKKVAGLAKLDEIEATYENDTYTPTITVENKSPVKVGEGDGVDYSANVMDGHVKSAILKGQTLVNLAIDNSVEFTTNDSWKHTQIKGKMLSTTKNYLVKFNSSQDYRGYVHLRDLSTNTYITDSILKNFKKGSNVVLLSEFLRNDLESFSNIIITFYADNNATAPLTITNIMLIEYQDGMENWGIPYFEGMQSVKLPVLTTTGKNLFDKEAFYNDWKSKEETYMYKETVDGEEVLKVNSMNLLFADNKGFKISVKKGVPLTMSFKCKKAGTSDTKAIFSVRFSDTAFKDIGKCDSYEWIQSSGTFTPTRDYISVCSAYEKDDYYYVKDIQLEYDTQLTTYEPYKSNILTVNEDIELRGIGEVKDELNCLTGEVTERIGEVVLDGKNDVKILISSASSNYPSITRFWLRDGELSNLLLHSGERIMCDKLPVRADGDYEKITASNGFDIHITTSKLSEETVEAFKEYLSQNPITVQYPLNVASVKTVDLMPSGTHPSTTPYCWKNGHIQLSSSGLLPNLEYSVVTSRAGQINQNATMIVKNDKRIFDLEILLAGGLVNTTYQALTLQNQVETGLSKVSLNSETEPDYLLYHMIMKLIEEKAYKLDDLTEKVSVFYLYEKLSDEQFETIYSALYPFAEDEIIEEPVVEELPEVVEDEVIM